MYELLFPGMSIGTTFIYASPPLWVWALWLLGMGLLLWIFLRPARRDRGRRMGDLTSWRYAHRGLHDGETPENSLPAFQAAAKCGFGVELDVHLSRDGRLVVFHDSELYRMCGRAGVVEEQTAAQLQACRLGGTDCRIPLLEEVLPLFVGKAPVIVELKTHGGNAAALTAATCNCLDGFAVTHCLESFDPRCLLWLRRYRPELPRGQLSQNFARDKGALSALLRFFLTQLLGNFLTYPDFIAYRFAHRHTFPLWLCWLLWRPALFYWTLSSKEELLAAEQSHACGIFEGFTPVGSRKGDPI